MILQVKILINYHLALSTHLSSSTSVTGDTSGEGSDQSDGLTETKGLAAGVRQADEVFDDGFESQNVEGEVSTIDAVENSLDYAAAKGIMTVSEDL